MDKRHDSEILAKRALQVQRGGARAAVLGVNDGLVSVLCIVLAVAGAGASQKTVLLSGLAGLIAGAISMAAGEWISVKSQVELFSGILKDISKLITEDRTILVEQLTASHVKSGLQEVTAKKASVEIANNDGKLVEEYAQHVMGFNPEELGSPWLAAISSFLLFTIGALAPLGPWFFGGGMIAIWFAVVFTAVGSLIVGGYIGYSSGRSVIGGAFRQFGIVVLASVVTYGIGHVLGAGIG